MLNIKQFVNPVVEGVSKLSFQCGSRDAKFCVSTIWLDKLLILNVLYIVANIETRHATSLLMAKSHFDTPSCGAQKKLRYNAPSFAAIAHRLQICQ